MGPEKRVLFQKNCFGRTFPSVTKYTTHTKLWNSFQQLYTILQQDEISSDEVDSFRKDAEQWVLDFMMVYQLKECYTIYSYSSKTYSRVYPKT